MKVISPSVCLKKEGEYISAKITASRGVYYRLALDWSATKDDKYPADDDGFFYARPCNGNIELWKATWDTADFIYQRLIKAGVPPVEAQEILPDSVIVTIRLSLNINDWKLFCINYQNANTPQLNQIARLAISMLKKLLSTEEFHSLFATDSRESVNQNAHV
jgi:hypothetical protein